MLLSALRKVRHRTFAGHEEVGTSPDGHEARQRCGALVEFFARDVQGRRVLRTAIIADQGISTAGESVETRVIRPNLLHELELTLDARVDAEEV